MDVYCEGAQCSKRDTCALHRDIKENINYEYIDFSEYGSGSADSNGNVTVVGWCGDTGDFQRYKPSATANITEYDYKTMWNSLKKFVMNMVNDHKDPTDGVHSVQFHMSLLENRFQPSFVPKVKIEDIREEEYENWNHYKYEDYNHCPYCDSKLHMTGQVSEVQTFICTKCSQRFALDVYKGNLTSIR